jgi:ATP-binding cassette, subfamily B, bacterial PglK
MILVSLLEVVSIGILVPFLGILVSPDYIYRHELAQPIINFLKFDSPHQLLLPIVSLFILMVIFSSSMRLLLLYRMTKLTYATGSDLSIDIYRRTLYQKYLVHTSRNSSEIINGIINKTNMVISSVINPVLILLSSMILVAGIITVLIYIDTASAVVTFSIFGGMYFAIITITRKRVQENSKCIALQSTSMIKSLQEGLGGIRDVLLGGHQEFYCKLYKNSDLPLRGSSANNAIISESPRHILEAIGMIVITLLAYYIVQTDNGMESVVPILGAFALGAQKLLPALQQSYHAFNAIRGVQSSLEDVTRLLDQKLPNYLTGESKLFKKITFKDKINLQNIGFKHSESENFILSNINLEIKKGESVGFIGMTGSGKSTLADIIMCLLFPSNGSLLIDGRKITLDNYRSWQAHISHVPQNIYLFDGTIEENIAFGETTEKINHNRVNDVIDLAQLSKFIDELPNGLKTKIGESGVRLSGGQRQRIGIARALYNKPEVLILDEATSALDSETESKIMSSIYQLDFNVTVLIIAHRISTLKECNKIIKLSNRRGVIVTTYEEIL